MKLDILMVSIRELSKSFPEWFVESIRTEKDLYDRKVTIIKLTNQSFDKVLALLDEDGKLLGREELINQRNAVNN